jgi:hypothetical protein
MGTTFSLHHILFPRPGLYPLSRPPQPPHEGKSRTSAQTEVTYPTILGSGSSNMLEFFEFDKKLNFCLTGLRKKLGQQKAGTTKKIGKSHMFLGTRPPLKKRKENPFLKDFFNFDKKIEKIW